MNQKEIHIISTGKQGPEEFCEIASLIHHNVTYIHIREKTYTARQLFDMVMLLNEANVPLSKIILNDRVDVADVTGVSGVQLAYHSLSAASVKKRFPHLRIGCSVHSLAELTKAQLDGADYVLFGHIYETHSKPGLLAKGVSELRRIVNQSSIPVIAIGGIKPLHVKDILETGASGIAVMSGVLEAKDPLQAMHEYVVQFEEGAEA
ncbi:thiazole tautomerase TenI [Bacillus sp. PS06]|uniref:thiazole tautomerase TenI n=1 Tax=Bacillus sp. PS06 TaxID=2764176 RepID=UPI0017868185|nr:thiazole tautomerase TenI [Bacillus sp. PS06]MBD8067757.1 thiazole tautomerase TenI [Bacillus sp. PS06]